MSKEVGVDNAIEDEESIQLVAVKKRKLTQTTLGTFARSSLEEVLVTGSAKSLDLSRVDVSNYPTWGTTIIPYFKFISHDITGKSKKYTMQCQVCEAENKETFVTDKCNASFTRHLERVHPEAFQALKNTKSSKSDLNAVQISKPQTTSHHQNYSRTHPKQKQFERDLVNLVVTDCVPFQIVEGAGFKTAINHLDDRIMIPHRTTLQRWMTDDYKKSIVSMKNELREMPPGCLHFIMDIWTSQQRQSIIGFKVQYVKDWKIRQLVVGFKHFPESHTAENIKFLLESLIKNELGLTYAQVGSVTADNASNILAAFKVTDVSVTGQEKAFQNSISKKNVGPENKNEDEEDTVVYQAINSVFHASNPILEDDRLLEELENLTHEELENNVDDTIPDILIETFNSLSGNVLKRNSCLAHLLQLAIRDSINANKTLVAIAKKVNDIVRFINNSNKSLAELRSKTGLSLVKPCVTRWNSLYYSLQRLLRDDKCKMQSAINEVLTSAKCNNKRTKVPVSIYDEDIDFIKYAVTLLKPFADLTNSLQADTVTSSLVILGIINAIRETTDVTFEEDLKDYEALLSLQKSLCDNVAKRFANDKSVDKDLCKSRGRPIVTVNVFKDNCYIIATLLDCRIKTRCFSDDLVEGTVLEGKLPTSEQALKILGQAFNSEIMNGKTIVRDLPNAADDLSTQASTSANAKKTMFSLVSPSGSSQSHVKTPEDHVNMEMQKYFQMEFEVRNAEKFSPLSFWYKNEDHFPNLCKLAVKYLSIPATSAAIERLFSVASALGKARNARLLPETVEKLLCLKYYRLT